MAKPDTTFGAFYDRVTPTQIIDGQVWMEEWQAMVSEDRWQEVRKMSLTDELVTCFAEDMVTAFVNRMHGIDTDALYTSTLQDGHAFLEEVAAAAKEFGVDVSQVVATPITPTGVVTQVQETLRRRD